MRIDFPEHPPGPWECVSFRQWLLGYGTLRRVNYRWTVDHLGCRCDEYWEFR